jgi:hypothetical protein
VLDQLYALVAGEPPPCRFEHEIGEVETHTVRLAPIDHEKGE